MLQFVIRLVQSKQKPTMLHRWCLDASPIYKHTCDPVTKARYATEYNCFKTFKTNMKHETESTRDPVSVFNVD